MTNHLNNNSQIISLVGQYIYDHSDQTITLEALAAHTGFSKFHFNRIFFAATGFQLGEFIQRQKLEKAFYLIKEGNENILHVALSVGYESASSFTRAFKKNFSVTPSDIIRGKLPRNERAGSLPPKKLITEQVLKPVWKTLPSRKIYGLYGKGFSKQSFSVVAGQLYGRLAELSAPLSYSQLQPIGVSIDNPWAGEQQESRFFAGFTAGLSDAHSELEVFHWQAGQWACFTHIGPHSTMWQTISQVYAQWVLPHNIKLKDQQIIQLYLNNPLETKPELMMTELYFAVEENP
ncbi:GyrI-like domain-containing protein [Psychrobium sp. 1_MG-2023]|uniref:GyrI-like domain-containing protein n=1 Tax=Psychrobium sp. 1_MG-2023 TaxID=3062624 RepID=UPI000C34E14E|nr:GyrI-like domain-containing protein [Psychrobium sp. 1_MG-2023]MDP2562897.1 GyrI-like domain-containing protein [Psychrobium sp. 1_MG-2023]PKF54044.1 AraC family transcriptional regulator [Alteromonadales bacterium alter-6D02]